MIPFFPYSEKIKREKMITFNPSHDLCNQYAEHFVQFRTFEHNIQQLAEIMHLNLLNMKSITLHCVLTRNKVQNIG